MSTSCWYNFGCETTVCCDKHCYFYKRRDLDSMNKIEEFFVKWTKVKRINHCDFIQNSCQYWIWKPYLKEKRMSKKEWISFVKMEKIEEFEYCNVDDDIDDDWVY